MSKPDLRTYNPFEKWPDGLHRDINFLGGSPLALLSVALQHYIPQKASTAVGLRDHLVQRQGNNAVWTPHLKGVVEIFDKLKEGPPGVDAMTSLNTTDQPPSYTTRFGKVAFAGVVFDLCNKHPEIYPQAIIGRAAKRLPGREMQPNPRPTALLGLYAMLGSSREKFSIPEISRVLQLDSGYGNHMVEIPAQQGILTVEKRGRGRGKPTLVQFTDPYREPMMDFSSNIEALGTSEGIENGLEMAESAIKSPAQVSHLMWLGKTWTAHQAQVFTMKEVLPSASS